MSGGPTDGLPWWGKAFFYVLLAPVAAVDGIVSVAEKVKEKLKSKKERKS